MRTCGVLVKIIESLTDLNEHWICLQTCDLCLTLPNLSWTDKDERQFFSFCLLHFLTALYTVPLLSSALPDLSIMWLFSLVSLQCVFVLVSSLRFLGSGLSIFRRELYTLCSQEALKVFHSECQVAVWLLRPGLLLVIFLKADGPFWLPLISSRLALSLDCWARSEHTPAAAFALLTSMDLSA